MHKTFASVALLGAALVWSAGCNVKRAIMLGAVESQVEFFRHAQSSEGLTQLSDRVYTFAHASDRGIAVVTDVGLVVSDSFNPDYAAGLREALAREGIDTPVHTLIYSHHHLDHVGGATELDPQVVIAHADVSRYWDDAPEVGFVMPTRVFLGDQAFEIGGVRFELLDVAGAHAPTLYALHIPDEGILYAPDTLVPNAFLFGFTPDVPVDGFLAAIDKLSSTSFDRFVASHLGGGSRADFDRTVAMLRDVRTTAQTIFAEAALRDGNIHYDPARTKDGFAKFYDALQPRYGDWHGFDANILPTFIRLYTSELLGDVSASPEVAKHDALLPSPRGAVEPPTVGSAARPVDDP